MRRADIYDPAATLVKVTAPTLAPYGALDHAVDVAHGRAGVTSRICESRAGFYAARLSRGRKLAPRLANRVQRSAKHPASPSTRLYASDAELVERSRFYEAS